MRSSQISTRSKLIKPEANELDPVYKYELLKEKKLLVPLKIEEHE
jgi:hypothetical protein